MPLCRHVGIQAFMPPYSTQPCSTRPAPAPPPCPRPPPTQPQLLQDLPLGGVHAVGSHQARLHEQAVWELGRLGGSSEGGMSTACATGPLPGCAMGWPTCAQQTQLLAHAQPATSCCKQPLMPASRAHARPHPTGPAAPLRTSGVARLQRAGGQQQLAVGPAVINEHLLARAAAASST